MDDPREWSIDDESDHPETCSKDVKKYFYMVGAAAVVILLGTFWYTQYYSKNIGMRSSIGGFSPPGAQPMAVNWFPRSNGANGAAATVGRRIKAAKGGFSSIAMSLRNSVVNVSTSSRGGVLDAAAEKSNDAVRFASPFSSRTNSSVGSGVIVRNDGYIITNYHVMHGAAAATVTVFNNHGTERYRANVVKMDEVTDLVLLKIEPRTPLTAAVLGDSNQVRPADEVIAIGSPFGLDQTVSRGIVSALRKSMVIERITRANLIQTDAAINQGNSGGPLISADGKVIGINTAIYTPTGAFSGIGFAIPSNQVKTFVKGEFMFQAAAQGSGSMAARGQFVAAPRGQMTPGAVGNAGPAITVGIFPPHTDGRQKMACESCHQVINGPGGGGGMTVAAPYQFATPSTTLAMNVAGAPGGTVSGAGFAVMGASLLPIGEGLAARLDHPSGKGLFVGNVNPGSPAAKAGLMPGDIILKAEGQRMWAPRQMADILMAMGNGETARLSVSRNGARTRLDMTVAILPPSAGFATAPAPAPQAAAAPRRVPTEFGWLGIEVENFTMVVPLDNPGAEPVRGAEIGEVAPGSAADKAKVQANDIIVKINSQPVGTAKLLDRAIRNADGKTANLLMLMRGGREYYVVLQ